MNFKKMKYIKHKYSHTCLILQYESLSSDANISCKSESHASTARFDWLLYFCDSTTLSVQQPAWKLILT